MCGSGAAGALGFLGSGCAPGRGGNGRMAGRGLPEKLYRIGEVMDHTGLSRQTLHFYTTLGLIREKKRTAAGYRLYPPSVFQTLVKVRALQQKG